MHYIYIYTHIKHAAIQVDGEDGLRTTATTNYKSTITKTSPVKSTTTTPITTHHTTTTKHSLNEEVRFYREKCNNERKKLVVVGARIICVEFKSQPSRKWR